MNRNVIVAIIILAIVGFGGYYLKNKYYTNKMGADDTMMKEGSATEESKESAMMQQNEDSMAKEGSSDTMMEGSIEESENGSMMADKEETMMENVKEFSISAKPFSFTPATMTVKKGDKVKITLTDKEGMHDLVIDEFNVKTKVLSAGETDTVEFTADKAGTYEYYCSVSNHRAMGMVGKLIVQE
jgi:nitrosocyanin